MTLYMRIKTATMHQLKTELSVPTASLWLQVSIWSGRAMLQPASLPAVLNYLYCYEHAQTI